MKSNTTHVSHILSPQSIAVLYFSCYPTLIDAYMYASDVPYLHAFMPCHSLSHIMSSSPPYRSTCCPAHAPHTPSLFLSYLYLAFFHFVPFLIPFLSLLSPSFSSPSLSCPFSLLSPPHSLPFLSFPSSNRA